jgi:predicted enzyme related to lactoylglutathione lyase
MEWTTRPCLHGDFCWHEVNTRDPAGTVGFYGALLGATTTSMPMPHGDYSMLAVDGHTVLGVMPLQGLAPDHVPTHWLGYVAVDDVDATTERAKQLGAQALVEPMDVPIGRWSLVEHPAGGVAALFQADPGKTDGTNSFGPGAVAWNHLATPDVEGAAAFWSGLLGWEAMPSPDGGADGSRRMTAHGRPVAGIMPSATKDDHPGWLAFIAVRDLADSLRRAIALGATQRTEPLPVAGLGTVVVLADPQGALFAIGESAIGEPASR